MTDTGTTPFSQVQLTSPRPASITLRLPLEVLFWRGIPFLYRGSYYQVPDLHQPQRQSQRRGVGISPLLASLAYIVQRSRRYLVGHNKCLGVFTLYSLFGPGEDAAVLTTIGIELTVVEEHSHAILQSQGSVHRRFARRSGSRILR